MTRRRRTLDDFEPKEKKKEEEGFKFSGPIKPGEVRNPDGRPKKEDKHKIPDENLLDIIKSSGGLERLYRYLNYELPPDEYETLFGTKQKLSKGDSEILTVALQKNYKWGMNLVRSSIISEMDKQRESDQPRTMAAFVKRIDDDMSPEEKRMLADVERKRRKFLEDGVPPDEAWAMVNLLELTWRIGVGERQLEEMRKERIRKQEENKEKQ